MTSQRCELAGVRLSSDGEERPCRTLAVSHECRILADQSHRMSGRDIKNWVGCAEQKAVQQAVQRAIEQGSPEPFLLAFEDFAGNEDETVPARL